VRVLLAESDVRDKKINELAAKLHSAEQQQKAAMQTVKLSCHNFQRFFWAMLRHHNSSQAHMMHQRLEMVFRQNEVRAKSFSNFQHQLLILHKTSTHFH
jgi:translation initiation factor 2B subunit (eIF-2B alpha/beta/delta family)